MPRPAPFWPAVTVTFLTGLAFAGLKFVLIGEIALDFKPELHEPLPFSWMEQALQACIAKGALREAVSQGLAAMLTLGVLVGYFINAPLAGAWRAAPLFLMATGGVAAGALATAWINPWLLSPFIGVIYGTACAARGKVVPLYAQEGKRSNTLVSGVMNAILVVGLLLGAVSGMLLFESVQSVTGRRLIIAGVLAIGMALSFWITPREADFIPVKTGLHQLLATSTAMFRRYWALLIAGGLAWGIASAASLAGMIYAIDDLEMTPTQAAAMVVFPAVGAIIGNLVSHWLDRRRYVIGAFLVLALTVAAFPLLAHSTPTAAVMMVLIGLFFAAPTNVLDAKLLANAAAEGDPGKGSTSMSLWHNVFILGIGIGLALPLFMGWMTAAGQFYFLSGITALTALITGFTHLSRSGGTVIDVEPVQR